MTTLAEAIQIERGKFGWGAEELAKRANVGYSWLTKLERGAGPKRPSRDRVERLTKVLPGLLEYDAVRQILQPQEKEGGRVGDVIDAFEHLQERIRPPKRTAEQLGVWVRFCDKHDLDLDSDRAVAILELLGDYLPTVEQLELLDQRLADDPGNPGAVPARLSRDNRRGS